MSTLQNKTVENTEELTETVSNMENLVKPENDNSSENKTTEEKPAEDIAVIEPVENATSTEILEHDKIVQDTLEKINSRSSLNDEDGMPEATEIEKKVSCTDIPKSEKANQFLASIKTGSSVLRKGMISSTEKLSSHLSTTTSQLAVSSEKFSGKMAISTKELSKELKAGSSSLRKATISGAKSTLATTKSLTNDVVKKTKQQLTEGKLKMNKARYINDGVTRIPLKKFIPDTVKAKMDSNALLTVEAQREHVEDTGRNGERKIFTQIEETCQLPIYLVENEMLKQVESKLINGFLVVTYPLDPNVEEEEASGENPTIVVPIEMTEE